MIAGGTSRRSSAPSSIFRRRIAPVRALRLLLLIVCCGDALVGCRNPGSEQPPADPAPRVAPGPDRLTIVTYNVLADRVGEPGRSRAVLDLLERADADVIALQEVAPWFLDELSGEAWVRRRYHGTEIDGRLAAPGGQYILTKLAIERSAVEVLPGEPRRTVLVAWLRAGSDRLAVATTHLESLLDDGPVRARQLDRIFSMLGDGTDAVVLGDFNFGDGEPEEARIPPSYVDLWTALRPGEPGFTWDMERSPMARQGSFDGERSRRLDRILVRSARWVPSRIEIVGDAAIDAAGGLFPSDHFGLLGEIRSQRRLTVQRGRRHAPSRRPGIFTRHDPRPWSGRSGSDSSEPMPVTTRCGSPPERAG